MSNKNLSELIFSDSRNEPPETSALLRKVIAKGVKDLNPSWYRVLNRREWAWRGIDPVQIEYILSKIAISNYARSDEDWLDSVIGYHSGNWSYEWNQLAFASQQRCENNLSQSEPEAGYSPDCLYASLLYSLSSYPHLKGDRLAFEAGIFSINAYKKAFSLNNNRLKNITIPYKKNSIQAMLHLPEPCNRPCPVVFVCSGLDSLLVDHYKLYENYLAPAGIAMLTMDAPGLGQHENYPLTENYSELHEQVIQYLNTVPWVDDNKIILLGIKFGTNIAARTAYLSTRKIKGLICVLPMVHEWFVNQKMQDAAPTMYQDIFYNRLDSSALSKEGFSAELSSFSLKKQGLTRYKLDVPFLGIQLDNPKIYQNLEDLKLLERSTKKSEILKVSNFWSVLQDESALPKIMNWIKRILL